MADESPAEPESTRRAATTVRNDATTAAGAEWSPGSVIAGRYRIVGPLGAGGMGRVYRADDLTLGISVALKFLSVDRRHDQRWLDHFRHEVRASRQVTHPNVCRVYDLGDVDGEPFISMEYVDGEDLAALLRRIGQLPEPKAVDIGRQLCAGLAAAHGAGVLHRDLKPANVMLDGRGQVRITDFGIAAVADRPEGEAVVAGTPAYMAPEILAGESPTVQSDLYSLGLVLLEAMTGRCAVDAGSMADARRWHAAHSPVEDDTLLAQVDPAIDRVLRRCLERDPRDRPASAVALAAALPGGDLLAEALAAGRTPSPELVAASGESGVLSRRAGLVMLALIALGFVLTALAGARVGLWQQLPLSRPPSVLVDRAREIFAQLGYDEPLRNAAFVYALDYDYRNWVLANVPAAEQRDRLGQTMPGVAVFWYRQSGEELEPSQRLPGAESRPRWGPLEAGDREVWLTTDGHLRALRVSAAERASPDMAVEWAAVLAAAGFDIEAMTPAEPQARPNLYTDQRLAWSGSYPDMPEVPVRLEAAAADGRPVYFTIIDPWDEPAAAAASPPGVFMRVIQGAMRLRGMLVLGLIAGAVLLARRNLLSGRGDRRGALRLAMVVLGCVLAASFLGAPNIIPRSTGTALWRLGAAAWVALTGWLAYLALEPYVRRHWPTVLISWSRLTGGRPRDPLVGTSVLVGVCAGALAAPIYLACGPLLVSLGVPGALPRWTAWIRFEQLSGPRLVVADWLEVAANTMIFGFLLMLLLVLLRSWLRRTWLAAAVWVLCTPLIVESDDVSTYLVSTVVSLVGLAVLMRYGVLALIAFGFTTMALLRTPITLDRSLWDAGGTLIALACVGGLAAFGFLAATARAARPPPALAP